MKYLFCFIIISPILFFLEKNAAHSPALNDEICNNAIDDDNDGFIDLNDKDCVCSFIEPVSFLPNPSFEEKDCCPEIIGKMDCAVSWVQASSATADYFHTCTANFGNLPIPKPLPDGEGLVGILNGEPAKKSTYKEYVGACLLSPLQQEILYRLEFFASFTTNSVQAPMNFTLYGTSDCSNLPFGPGIALVGCPTNTSGWIKLGDVYSGSFNGWKKLSISFTPPYDIEAIVMGPPCEAVDRINDTRPHYYFLDKLTLDEEFSFEFEIQSNDQPCRNDISLEVPDYTQLEYQWYKDGVALIGETNSSLSSPIYDGSYQVSISNGLDCSLTLPFDYSAPVFNSSIKETICEGESFFFKNQALTSPGTFVDTLSTAGGCDSIVILDLQIMDASEVEIEARIFPNERYQLGDFSFSTIGEYTRTLSSELGCDSIVHLNLEYYSVYIPNAFSPNGDEINDCFTIYGAEELQNIESLTIFNQWGNQVLTMINLQPNVPIEGWDGTNQGKPLAEGVYIYQIEILMNDGRKKSLSGSITLFR